MHETSIPGMQVAVVRRWRIVCLEAIDAADVENPIDVTNTTRFQIASCTKAFVAVAIMPEL